MSMSTTTHTIRKNARVSITLPLRDNYRPYLVTEYTEPGFPDAWTYRTPFQLKDGDWFLAYREGETNIPQLDAAERERCLELIDEFDERPF